MDLMVPTTKEMTEQKQQTLIALFALGQTAVKTLKDRMEGGGVNDMKYRAALEVLDRMGIRAGRTSQDSRSEG